MRSFPLLLAAAAAVACASTERPSPAPGATIPSSPGASTTSPASSLHPDVIDVTMERRGDVWRVSATISSPYDTPERYADAFRVLAPDGTVLGVRELLHDHAGEQPFTRSLDGVEIPNEVDRVTIEGRDQVNGWGGDTVTVEVPR